MKSRLDRQNEEIAVLRAQLAEAEAGKEGMVERINILLTRASEKEASGHMGGGGGGGGGRGGGGGGGGGGLGLGRERGRW